MDCSCDFSLSERIFDSPQRDQAFHPTTSDGSLDAKVTYTIACYICYPHRHTLSLSTLSRFFLDCGFSRTSLQGELPIHRSGKHYKLPLTVDCTISLGERMKETQRGKKERKRFWQRPIPDFCTIQTLDKKYGKRA